MNPDIESNSPASPVPPPAVAPGCRLAHYEIVEQIGQGGMGRVYKARDTVLDRLVAIKIIRPELSGDADRKQRFMREARAASALNHPNIVTVYAIDEEQGQQFIAMEYVRGVSLNAAIPRPSSIKSVLDLAIQIADALETAHAAGIVHRDLKPGNIMVTDRKLVKVLDFGLAKLIEPAEGDVGATLTPLTRQGLALGTPGYMSPEQAEGRPLDARVDIFSFGAVLYEMVTGERAFSGASTASVLASLLRDVPIPPSAIAPGVPPELDAVVARCLQKDPEKRWQSMADARVALEQLRKEWIASGEASTRTTAAQIATLPKWRGKAIWIGVAAAVVAAALLYPWRPAPAPLAQPATPTRLTSNPGLSTEPAISADGKMLAYASDRAGRGNLDIWVRQIGGSMLQLTTDAADDYQPNFSPDGTQIAFRSDRDGGGIYTVSTLGGPARRVADQGREPRFSPDGARIAYWVGVRNFARSVNRSYVVNAGGGPPTPIQPTFATVAHPIWTPDGAHILFWGQSGGPETNDWWIAPLNGGAAVRTNALRGDRRWQPFGWRGNRVVFIDESSDHSRIAEIPLSSDTWQPTGPERRLTFGTTREESPSVAANGRVAFSSVTGNDDIYAVKLNSAGQEAGPLLRLTDDHGADTGCDLSADGRRLLFLSDRTDTVQVWIKDLETGDERALTSAARGIASFFSAENASAILYTEAESKELLLAPINGSAVRRLCQDCGTGAGMSRDGARVLLTDYTKQSTVRVLEVASGHVFEYLKHPRYSLYPRGFSPDGRWIAFIMDRKDGVPQTMLAPFRPSSPPEEKDWIQVTDTSSRNWMPNWSPDGERLYFISDRDGFNCIWTIRLDPITRRPLGEPAAVKHIHGATLRLIATKPFISVSRDKISFGLESRTGNIWMIEPLGSNQ